MKLYSFSYSCALSCHLALLWSKLPFELQQITHEDLASAEIRALNPAGKVPILTDNELVLSQSSAILNYIAERAPEAGLSGTTPAERAQTNMWLGLLTSDLHPAYSTLFKVSRWLKDEQAADLVKQQAKASIRQLYEQIDAQLAGREWLTGTRSIADAYLFVTLLWAGLLKIDLSGLENLTAFSARLHVTPEAQQVLRAAGIA